MNEIGLNRLSRLISILTKLQSKRLVTAPELALRYDVSVRTIYRDIKALMQAGIPIYTVEGRGYSIMKHFHLPPISFTESEANALVTANKMVETNKDSSFIEFHNDAIVKIKSALVLENKDKTELLESRIYIFKQKDGNSSRFLSQLQASITASLSIEIDYVSLSKNEKTTRKINPFALYNTRDNWLLIAWCLKKNAFREFRLDRIQKLIITNDKFEDNKFSLSDYFRNKIGEL